MSKNDDMIEVSNTIEETGEHEQIETIMEQECAKVERYKLPPRENWGRPHKRYTPEKESRRTTYPIINVVRGGLSNEANAFIMSVYSKEILNTLDKIQQSKA